MESKKESPASENESGIAESFINILFVEDNPGDYVIVRELLKESGCKFTHKHALDLTQTYAFCQEQDFDVILLDLGLPGSTTLETLKMIKVFNIKSAIIVLTGLDDEDAAITALREGAQDYLLKNKLTPETVQRSIKYSIERKKVQDLIRKHRHQFSILSSATAAITRCEDIKSIYSVTCSNISFLLEGTNAIAVEFVNRESVRALCTEWLEPWYDKIKAHIGIDMSEPVFHVREQKVVNSEMFRDGNIHTLTGGLYELLEGNFNKKSCQELEKLIGINSLYVFGFVKAGHSYGGGIIFSEKIIDNEDISIIETIINQASLSIHRRMVEKDLRLSENRYKRLNRELEQKVEERTLDLANINENLERELFSRIKAEKALKVRESQLEELNATKDKFFNIVAHDLKNPFTSLIGASELLSHNISKMEINTIRKLATNLNDSAKSGYAILQNLLDWSRSQTGLLRLNPENTKLSKLIQENILNFQLSASNKSISLVSEVEDDICVITDRCMVETILRNLISNAIKYTNKGGKVVVSSVINSSLLMIMVRDSGTGISPEDVKKLFRIDVKYSLPGTEHEQGTGLGLKLCKEFAEKLGGTLSVESSVGKGSVFSLSIPLKKEAERSSHK